MMRPCSDRGISRFLALAILIALAITLAAVLPGVSADGGEEKDQVPSLPDKTALNYPNLGSHLDDLVARVEAGQATSKDAAGETSVHSGESVAVTIYLTGNVDAVVTFLEDNGGDPRNVGEDYIEAYVPLSLLGPVSEQPGVVRVREIVPPQPAQDVQMVAGHGPAAHLSAAWNQAGYSGQDVKVGIIDGGFKGFSGLIGTELPEPAGVMCFTDMGRFTRNLADCEGEDVSVHGTAVAEAVIDIAPQVTLYIADPYTQGDLHNIVDWMISEGVSVINVSLVWPFNGPGDGTSTFSGSALNAVDRAVDGGIIWVNAAGNEAEITWFSDSPTIYTATLSTSSVDFVAFDGADDISNDLRGDRGNVIIQLRWDDTWDGASSDVDLILWDTTLVSPVARAEDYQTGLPGHIPREILSHQLIRNRLYEILVIHRSGSVPDWVQVSVFSGDVVIEHFTEEGSISNPAESANLGMLAVGATHYWDTHTIADYSSQGPTPDGRVKPDIVGTACGETASNPHNLLDGEDCWFAGTSQASPHVAGLAALVRQKFPNYTPQQVAQYLKDHAERRGNVPNNTWGYGFAVLPAHDALAVAEPPRNLTATASGPTGIDLSWSAPANNGGSAVTGYRIEVSTDGTAWRDLVADTNSTGTTYSHTGLTAGISRYYRVSAINSAGTSLASNVATATTAQPSDLVVESPGVDNSSPGAGASFTLSATVRNQGNGPSASTTLRYYRSTDASITTGDTEVGTGSVSGLAALGSSPQSISLTAPSKPGTYYYGACVDAVSDESNTGNNCSFAVAVTVPASPDLIVQSPSVSDSSPDAGTPITLSATVRNQGSGPSDSTTLRYYQSADSSISSSDTAVGTDSVSGLSASGTSAEDISLTAPSTPGTYYYGACVDSVSGESDAGNNCSGGVAVAVGTPPAPDLVVDNATVSDSAPSAGASFILSATVRNQGSGPSDSTTLRYYRSTDAAITTGDTAVGTDSVGGLNASGTSPESISLTAPSTAGTYYYGACVDAVSGESNTGNNCSAAVPVTVRAAPAEREALVALYEATGGSNWYNNRNWLSNAPLGDWYGVDTDADGGVTSLNLRRNGLTGEIPPELGDLTSLESLHLHDNDLSGCVPVALRGVAVRGARLPFCDALAGGIPAAPAWIKYEHIDVSLAPDHVNVWWAETPGAYWYQTGKLGEVGAPATATIDGETCGFIFEFFCGGPPYKVRACNADGCSDWTHTLPLSPADVQYQRDGSTIVVSWSSVTNADHYKVYHHNSDSSSCRLDSSGNPSSCEELTGAVVGTSFTHTNPDENANYYWVVACNSAGCSEIDSANPATFVGGLPAPASPPNQRYVWQGLTTVVSWDAVSGADHYTVYYDDFFSSSCRLSSGGSPSFCDELATNIRGTSYTHTSPDEDDNYYWVVACNSGGCSDIDSANSARFIDTRTPDLVVDTPTVSDDSPDAGERFTLRATVRNQGNGSSDSTTLRYYRSTDSTITTGDAEVGTDSVSSLSASRSGAESISLTAPSAAGTYYYGACVDAVSAESDTGNNCSTAVTVTVGAAPSPDLVVDAPTVSESAPMAGSSITLRVTVRNQGNGPSDSTTLRYYRSTDSTISSSDTAVGTDPVGALAASGSSPESIRLTAPSTPGTYHYGACVDAVSDESDTTNNCSTGVAVAVGEAPAPDLVVDTPTVSDSAPAAGGSFTLSAAVRNQGSGSSASTTLRYYRSTDATIALSDTAVGTDYVSRLDASESGDESVSLSAPSTPGTYYYGACVDAVSGGSDTTNNCSTAVAVAVGEVLGNPANQRYSWEGSTTVLSWDAVAGADYYKIYYDDFFSSGCRLSSSGRASFCDELAANVAGTSYTHTSPDDDDNYYWVTACNSGGCSEIDSDNPASLEGSAPAPDLVVDNVTVSDSAPAAGASFTLSAAVRNQGNGSSDSTTLRYYRSTDATIAISDTEVGTDYVSRLDVSESGDESVRLTAPSTPGTYYYGACVDAVSDESDTTNNCSTAVAVAVGETPAPDLVVDNATVSDSAPAAGGSFTLSAAVRNQGSGSSASTTLRYYRSTDATIAISDTEVGTDYVFRLDASESGDESVRLTAPSTPGTY